MAAVRYPGAEWERVALAEAGMDADRLESARSYLDQHANDPSYREAPLTCQPKVEMSYFLQSRDVLCRENREVIE